MIEVARAARTLCTAILAATTSAKGQALVLPTGHTLITNSCRIAIAKGAILEDTTGTGVIEIGASNIRIEFVKGSALRGSPTNRAPDQYRGYGIRLNGHTNVTISGAKISGYWCGIWATKADGVELENIDASDNRRARLKSTSKAEDESDWLYGHENDQKQWLTNYGAAIYIEDCAQATVRDSKVWHGQNALCLDQVTDSRIYDNDFSFNSGWGIALWRSSRNVISRNAVDFCVRGYSHGIYNRGQDSAGIFAFEQNNENFIVENSVTHGGDGFFGFAGREALGETGEHPIGWYKRRGNSNNLLIGNDFSYAAAHGIENTFSFGNRYLKNRIVGNAICGIWIGYSRDSLIAENGIENNGEKGYGLERGGVNIDHGGDNAIIDNRFVNNKCGVHLWGGSNASFENKPWAKENGYASTGSLVAGNTFVSDSIAMQFRGPGDVTVAENKFEGVGNEIAAESAFKIHTNDIIILPTSSRPKIEVFGRKHPVGARARLRGRENIIMTEWGPWDHLTPLAR
jgi:parallel beta-helix repeat protein